MTSSRTTASASTTIPTSRQTSGVGLVHQAPAFGEEDFAAAVKDGVISADRPPPNPVDDNRCFTSEVKDFEGQDVKYADNTIIKYLRERGRLIVDSQIAQQLGDLSAPHRPHHHAQQAG